VKKREFITLLGGAAVWSPAAKAQQAERTRRIGVLVPATADDAEFQARVGAFLQGLQQSGWNIGPALQLRRGLATALRRLRQGERACRELDRQARRRCGDRAAGRRPNSITE